MKRFNQVVCLLAAAFAGSVSAAAAQETVLTFAEVVPPGSVLDKDVFQPWVKRVNEQGKGVVRIDLRAGPTIANFENVYSRVLDDVVQIGWSIQAAVAGKFPLSNVVGLPFLFDKADSASAAFWRIYKAGDLNSEYDTVVPLMLTALPSSGIHFVKQPKTLDTLAGLKVQVTGRIQGQTAAKLGATPMSLPLTDMYEGLQRGTIDATMIAWVAFSPWKLGEVTSYHVDAPMGGAAGMVFMSKKKFDALPANVRKILQDNSTEAESRAFGAATQAEDDRQRALTAASPKQTVIPLPAQQMTAWREKAETVVQEWAKASPAAGKVLADYRKELAAAEGKH